MSYFEAQQEQKTKNILNLIIALYGLRNSDTGEYTKAAQTMLDNVNEYSKVFADYHEADIVSEIQKYWRYHSDKQRPSLRQIVALLETANKNKIGVVETVAWSKPVCPIADWQDDWDLVCRWACIYGIVTIPFWSNQECVVAEHAIATRKPFSQHKYKQIWAEGLLKARIADSSAFERIRNYHWLVHYTWAYRVGALTIPTNIEEA